MAAERVTELLTALQGLGFNADPTATQAIATVMAGIENTLRTEMEATRQSAGEKGGGKKWSDRVAKDDNTFRFDGKNTDGMKGFALWKWYMEMAIQHNEPYVLEQMKKAEEQNIVIDNHMINAPFRENNTNLFYALISCLEGNPLTVVKTCQGNGLEAWRRLCARYSVNVHLQMMSQLAKVYTPPMLLKVQDIKQGIIDWENASHVLETEYQVKPPEGWAKVIIFIAMIPRKFTLLIRQSMTKDTGYDVVKESIIRQVDGEEDKRDHSPMQVDGMAANTDGGEHGGYGWPQLGGDHEAQDLNAWQKGGKGGGKFAGQCYTCGEYGHRSAECPKATKRLCYNCGSDQHMAKDCPTPKGKGGGYKGGKTGNGKGYGNTGGKGYGNSYGYSGNKGGKGGWNRGGKGGGKGGKGTYSLGTDGNLVPEQQSSMDQNGDWGGWNSDPWPDYSLNNLGWEMSRGAGVRICHLEANRPKTIVTANRYSAFEEQEYPVLTTEVPQIVQPRIPKSKKVKKTEGKTMFMGGYMQRSSGRCTTGCGGCDNEVESLLHYIEEGIPPPPGIDLNFAEAERLPRQRRGQPRQRRRQRHGQDHHDEENDDSDDDKDEPPTTQPNTPPTIHSNTNHIDHSTNNIELNGNHRDEPHTTTPEPTPITGDMGSDRAPMGHRGLCESNSRTNGGKAATAHSTIETTNTDITDDNHNTPPPTPLTISNLHLHNGAIEGEKEEAEQEDENAGHTSGPPSLESSVSDEVENKNIIDQVESEDDEEIDDDDDYYVHIMGAEKLDEVDPATSVSTNGNFGQHSDFWRKTIKRWRIQSFWDLRMKYIMFMCIL